MDGDWPEVLNMRLIWFILISLVPFAYPASSAEPLSFDGIGPLGWVPGFDLLDLDRCEYCATETFDGVPSPQRFTGSGGLTEIYYAMPEHGQGLPHSVAARDPRHQYSATACRFRSIYSSRLRARATRNFFGHRNAYRWQSHHRLLKRIDVYSRYRTGTI